MKNHSYLTLINEIKSEQHKEEYRPLTKPEEKIMIENTPNREELNQKLIKHNITLVLKEINKYRNQVDIDDLFQNGMIGLVIASERFDIEAPNRFSTFAYWYIKKYVYNSYHEHNKQFDGKTNGMVSSLDQPIGDEESGTTLMNMVDNKSIVEKITSGDPLHHTVANDTSKFCKKLFNDIVENGILTDREKYVLDQRYVVGSNNTTIANDMKVSRTYVSHIHKTMINKLNKYIKHTYNVNGVEDILYV